MNKKMSKIRKEIYEEFYYKFDEMMRNYIRKQKCSIIPAKKMPGYEMLRILWIEYQFNNEIAEEETLKIVVDSISVKTSKEITEKEREPELQKMIEVIRSLGDEESTPLEFVKKL